MALTTTKKSSQTAYHIGRGEESIDIDEDLFQAMQHYLVEDLGIDKVVARHRAQSELERSIPKYVINSLSNANIQIAGKEILDLGAGLGGMSEELLLNGARLASLEPGAAWAQLTKRRVERHPGEFQLLNAFGEAIPLPDASVDLIVSLQVLEHVKNPNQVLAEAWRVLRPGGYFWLSCENYLSFREAHYQVPWFPLLPKPLGAMYLRLLGRSPKFLTEAITYTTYPGVIQQCYRLGFARMRDQQIQAKLKLKSGAKWKVLQLLAHMTAGKGPIWLDLAANTFKFGISELLQKPLSQIHEPHREH